MLEKKAGGTHPLDKLLRRPLVEKGTVDATVHPPPPPSPPSPPPCSLLLRLPLARPVLPVAATHTKESTSATTIGPGYTPWGTTTQDPSHVPHLYPELARSRQMR